MIERDYVRYALDNYQAPLFNLDEFNGDLNKVIVLKKLFRRFTNDGDINERLVLNHIIIVLNQFGVKAGNIILFYKVEREHHSVLKTFLMFLHSFHDNEFVDDLAVRDPRIIQCLKDSLCQRSSLY